jgi:F-type H+-transporting ATPase subunit alpha
VGEEVVTILAGSAGLLDDIPVEKVTGFATDMLRWLNDKYPDLVAEINKTGKLSDELAGRITDRVNEYKAIYKETRP